MFSPNISVDIFDIFLKIYFKYRYELLIIFLTIRLFLFCIFLFIIFERYTTEVSPWTTFIYFRY